MRYERGNAIIEVSQIDGFGKFPGLWIGTKDPNTLTKVASFRNDICAETFIKWFDYMVGAEMGGETDDTEGTRVRDAKGGT